MGIIILRTEAAAALGQCEFNLPVLVARAVVAGAGVSATGVLGEGLLHTYTANIHYGFRADFIVESVPGQMNAAC